MKSIAGRISVGGFAALPALLSAMLTSVAAGATDFPGNPPITPRWALEPWAWEDNGNTASSAIHLIDGYLSRDIPVGVIIIDSPWSTAYMGFEFDSTRYPDPSGLIASLREQGVQVVCWMVGMVNQSSLDVPLSLHPLFNDARTSGFALRDPANPDPSSNDLFSYWKGTGLAIDFTNPKAVDWFLTNMNASLISMGVRGFKVDVSDGYLSDPVQTTAGSIFGGAKIARAQHTEYYYGKVCDWIRAQTGNEGIILARPYSYQKHNDLHCPVSRLTGGFCGDFGGDFAGFISQLSNIYISVANGYSAVGLEVGGYNGANPTHDSLLRQAQYAALLPVMDNGGANGGLTYHLPWYWDSNGYNDTVSIYRYYATLHHNLVPFQFHCGVTANLTGQPALTQVDPVAYRHLLGNTFLTWAVTVSGSPSVAMAFPAGSTWIDWWNQTRTFAGGTQASASYTIDKSPIFIRAGSIVPVSVDSSVTGLGDANSTGQDTVLFFPLGTSQFVYHRPLGDAIAYEDVRIAAAEGANGWVEIDSPTSRSWILKIKAFAAPQVITGADSWSYDNANDILTIWRQGSAFKVSVSPLSAYSTLVPPPPGGASLNTTSLGWSSSTDMDEDTYTRSRVLSVDADIDTSGEIPVRLKCFTKLASASTYPVTPFLITSAWAISGAVPDPRGITVAPELYKGLYDFKLVLEQYVDGSWVVADEESAATVAILQAQPFEQATQDQVPSFREGSPVWSGAVDEDGDTFTRSRVLSVDADIDTAGDTVVRVQVFARPAGSDGYSPTPCFTSASWPIVGIVADPQSLPLAPDLSQGAYDFKVILDKYITTGTGWMTADEVSADELPSLKEQKFETAAQDTVAASPVLSVGPLTLAASCVEGANAPSQSFEVWNSGGGTVSYSITDSATWLSCSPTSGTTIGEHDPITVSYSSSGLAAGTYPATISVTASGVSGSPQTVAVTLTVTPAEPLVEVIKDNADASGVVFVGAWSSGLDRDAWGGSFRHDGNGGKGTKSATFTPVLSGGTYQVHLWYGAGANRANNVPVDVVHAGGTSTVVVNQQVNGARWNLLGTYSFDAGSGGYVRIRTAGTSGYVIADAVRFVRGAEANVLEPPETVDVTTVDASWMELSRASFVEGWLVLEYVWPAGSQEKKCVIEASEDLSHWLPAEDLIEEVITPETQSTAGATTRYLLPVEGTSARYFRLRWIGPNPGEGG